MPKKIIIEIVESLKFLKNEHLKAKGELKKDCIKVLIYSKEENIVLPDNIALMTIPPYCSE